MHDGIRFDKILPKQVGYFGKRIILGKESTENNHRR
jgi:hypothetical protein